MALNRVLGGAPCGSVVCAAAKPRSTASAAMHAHLPSQVFSTQLPESICTVDGGYVTSAAAADIIVHTFTGKVRLARELIQFEKVLCSWHGNAGGKLQQAPSGTLWSGVVRRV